MRRAWPREAEAFPHYHTDSKWQLLFKLLPKGNRTWVLPRELCFCLAGWECNKRRGMGVRVLMGRVRNGCKASPGVKKAVSSLQGGMLA